VSNPILKKSYTAGSVPINARTFVKFGAASGEVVPSAAGADASIGVTDQFCDPLLGDRLDVCVEGIADVQSGAGAINRGDFVMSDANGNAVTWVTPGRVCGTAFESAAAGDVIPVDLHFGH
jgi:hypothetical protein